GDEDPRGERAVGHRRRSRDRPAGGREDRDDGEPRRRLVLRVHPRSDHCRLGRLPAGRGAHGERARDRRRGRDVPGADLAPVHGAGARGHAAARLGAAGGLADVASVARQIPVRRSVERLAPAVADPDPVLRLHDAEHAAASRAAAGRNVASSPVAPPCDGACASSPAPAASASSGCAASAPAARRAPAAASEPIERSRLLIGRLGERQTEQPAPTASGISPSLRKGMPLAAGVAVLVLVGGCVAAAWPSDSPLVPGFAGSLTGASKWAWLYLGCAVGAFAAYVAGVATLDRFGGALR